MKLFEIKSKEETIKHNKKSEENLDNDEYYDQDYGQEGYDYGNDDQFHH